MAAHVDDLMALLDHADAADALVVGQSMGGVAAVVTDGRHPGRVRDPVLAGGGLIVGSWASWPAYRPGGGLRGVRLFAGPAGDDLPVPPGLPGLLAAAPGAGRGLQAGVKHGLVAVPDPGTSGITPGTAAALAAIVDDVNIAVKQPHHAGTCLPHGPGGRQRPWAHANSATLRPMTCWRRPKRC